MKVQLKLTIDGRAVPACAVAWVEQSIVTMGLSHWMPGVCLSVACAADVTVGEQIAEHIAYCLNEAGELNGVSEGWAGHSDTAPEFRCEYRVTMTKREREYLSHLQPRYVEVRND